MVRGDDWNEGGGCLPLVSFKGRHSHVSRVIETRPGVLVRLITRLQKLVHGDEGQDLLEYALLVSLIALVAVLAITTTGQNVNTIFTNIAAALLPAQG